MLMVLMKSIPMGICSKVRLSPNAATPAGPVLLVATDVRTRWTATVAAALLREQGASQVLLLALHLRP